MNTYLIPIREANKLYIKKVVATSENAAFDKLYDYFFNKYEELTGEDLITIRPQLHNMNIDFGQIYDSEELI